MIRFSIHPCFKKFTPSLGPLERWSSFVRRTELGIPEDSQQGFLVPASSGAISGCWGSGRGQGFSPGGKPASVWWSPECVWEQQSCPWELGRHPGPWAPLPPDLLNEDLSLQSFWCREPWGFCQGRGGSGLSSPTWRCVTAMCQRLGPGWVTSPLWASVSWSGRRWCSPGRAAARVSTPMGSAPWQVSVSGLFVMMILALDLTLVPITALLSLSSFFWLLLFCWPTSFPLWTIPGCMLMLFLLVTGFCDSSAWSIALWWVFFLTEYYLAACCDWFLRSSILTKASLFDRVFLFPENTMGLPLCHPISLFCPNRESVALPTVLVQLSIFFNVPPYYSVLFQKCVCFLSFISRKQMPCKINAKWLHAKCILLDWSRIRVLLSRPFNNSRDFTSIRILPIWELKSPPQTETT